MMPLTPAEWACIPDVDPCFPTFSPHRCYLWQGTRENKYGSTYACPIDQIARRIKRFHTHLPHPLPPSTSCNVLRHLCQEYTREHHGGLCINPHHLIWGTHADNAHDRVVHKWMQDWASGEYFTHCFIHNTPQAFTLDDYTRMFEFCLRHKLLLCPPPPEHHNPTLCCPTPNPKCAKAIAQSIRQELVEVSKIK